MRKLIFLIVILSFASLLFAGDFTLGSTDNETIKLSANVSADYDADTNGNHYVAGTMSSKGTKKYGTADTESVIYYDECTGNDCADDNVTFSGYSSGLSTIQGWTPME
ncbi:conserved hypothetical protein [Deferribacter desulfuricans SSM1]|uniref:Uncharacterized protein n=1 Tax=Deferribacter desulfuricans (strain DSM 14783 / JCM 11476 / NBRC 101012 / SSM1) TaxID=639282 RepID=D3PDR5_DEFDS|nr:hypothetical protein [Deferribacter desulfuricans]BAI80738.1 conserved hypothetical protein [Deferribacter desulfuricans SSM1]